MARKCDGPSRGHPLAQCPIGLPYVCVCSRNAGCLFGLRRFLHDPLLGPARHAADTHGLSLKIGSSLMRDSHCSSDTTPERNRPTTVVGRPTSRLACNSPIHESAAGSSATELPVSRTSVLSARLVADATTRMHNGSWVRQRTGVDGPGCFCLPVRPRFHSRSYRRRCTMGTGWSG